MLEWEVVVAMGVIITIKEIKEIILVGETMEVVVVEADMEVAATIVVWVEVVISIALHTSLTIKSYQELQ